MVTTKGLQTEQGEEEVVVRGRGGVAELREGSRRREASKTFTLTSLVIKTLGVSMFSTS